MRKLPPFLLCAMALVLAACAPDSNAPDSWQFLTDAFRDPAKLPVAYATICVGFVVGLLFLSGHTFKGAVLDAIRLTSLLCFVTSPLYYLATHNVGAGIAMGLCGMFGLAGVTAAFWRDLYPPRSAPKAKPKDKT